VTGHSSRQIELATRTLRWPVAGELCLKRREFSLRGLLAAFAFASFAACDAVRSSRRIGIDGAFIALCDNFRAAARERRISDDRFSRARSWAQP